MIIVYGNPTCMQCKMVKNLLSNNNVEFEYRTLNDVPKNENQEVMDLAKEQGINHLPLVLDTEQNKLVNYKDLINA